MYKRKIRFKFCYIWFLLQIDEYFVDYNSKRKKIKFPLLKKLKISKKNHLNSLSHYPKAVTCHTFR